jgi:hypothetical protein
MENDQEIAKLTRILRGISRADRFAGWREPQADVARFSIDQFNRVLTRLIEIEPSIAPLFAPLGEHATLEMARMAAHDLASYFADETQVRHEGCPFKGCGVRVMVGAMPGRRGRYC